MMRTHRDFWRHRFRLNLRPADGLNEGAWVLREGRERYVAYSEDTDAITLDVSSMSEPQPAVAVDSDD